MLEILRLHGRTGTFAHDLFQLLERPVEVPLDQGAEFCFWANRCDECQPGYSYTAAVYPEFEANRTRPSPAVQFWLIEGPACHREFVPHRLVDSATGCDEWFAEFAVGHAEIRPYDVRQFEGLRFYVQQWDAELRARDLLPRYRASHAFS